ncbi:MAG: hypothetical protein ACRD2B_13320 [Terriglobia bacterium]
MVGESQVNTAGAGVEPEVVPGPPAGTEPFACPNCGQMLAPTCRVCVACHEPVDFAKLAQPEPAPSPPPVEPPLTLAGKTQFSWRIFLAVLGAYIALVILTKRYMGSAEYEGVLAGVLLVTSAWVFYDAYTKRVPHPFRWGISSLLLWIVVFPWYLSRRRAPEAPCPLMEAQASVFIRALVWFVLIFFILSMVATLLTRRFPH